jgi:hypothetical protein
MELKGRGVVNFDSNEQKYMWNNNTKKTGQEMVSHDNVNFAKNRWYKNEDGSFNHKLIVSSNCMRHNIFSDDTLFQSPNIINNSTLLNSMIATPGLLLRGYMFAEKDPAKSIKRSSVLNITDAEQTNNAVSTIETFSRSGEKVVDENKSDITFYKKETVGEITYESIGSIDLMQMQFVSCDQLFDRLALNPDLFEDYSNFLSAKLPDFNSKLSYYQIKGSAIELPEYGFMLSKENIIFLTKELFKRLLNLKIRNASAYAETVNVQYKIITNPFEDKMNNNDGWVNLTEDGINSIDFEPENFYIEYNFAKAKELRLELEEKAKARKEANKEEAAAKKEEAKRRREAKKKVAASENSDDNSENNENNDDNSEN